MTIDQPITTDDTVVVHLVGDYDMSNAADLREALLEPADADTVIADLTDVRFMDSTSLRALIEVRARLGAEGRSIRLTNPNTALRRLFEVVALDDLFGLEPL